MRTIVMVLTISLLLAGVVCADDLLTEIEDVVIKRVETSCLIGNIGPAVGLYWPMTTITKLDVTVGPMGALGNEAVVAGAGAQTPVSITVLGFEVPIDFGFVGIAYDWIAKETGVAAGVGKVFVVAF